MELVEKVARAGNVDYFAKTIVGGTTVGDVRAVGAKGENGWEALYNVPEGVSTVGAQTYLDQAIAYFVMEGKIPSWVGDGLNRKDMPYLTRYIGYRAYISRAIDSLKGLFS